MQLLVILVDIGIAHPSGVCVRIFRDICWSLSQDMCQRDYASSFIPGRREPKWVYRGVFIHSVISPFFIFHC